MTVGAINLAMWLSQSQPNHVGIWYKGEGATTHGVVTQYWTWEPILFFGKWERKRHTDFFEYTAGSGSYDHPCPKPLALWKDLMENFSEQNETLYDPFLGSGTTLIAAEQLGRTCMGIEIEPRYCDVAVKRWEVLTGKKAERITPAAIEIKVPELAPNP